MTCKISFFKSVKETLKHHIASVFGTFLIFFIQFLTFFLSVQNLAQDKAEALAYGTSLTRIESNLQSLTLPEYGYMVPIMIVGVLLSYDFFRYLHSRKQLDFYESLPVKRSTWFGLRTFSAIAVFLLSFTLCIALEAVILSVFGFFTKALFVNLLWNYLCMILIFLMVWVTTTLAMVMTGHTVIAFLGFGVFCSYIPLFIRYLFPSYAETYLKTYSSTGSFLKKLTYISPVSAAIKLLSGTYDWANSYLMWTAKEHTKDFIIILILIGLTGLITYALFLKRPSETAGRAMSFEAFNPVIRIGLVVPLSLYLGLFLATVSTVGEKLWMIIGFFIGCILLHGLIESIFQFDIRGFFSHKIQLFGCFAACVVFACIFWFDLFGYNTYLPKKENLTSIAIELNTDYLYYNDTVTSDGLTGEVMENAYLLAQKIVEQDLDSGADSTGVWITFEYRLKSGSIKRRIYYMDLNSNRELFDKIYATKEYKDDYCNLYQVDRSIIQSISWNDGIDEMALAMSEEQMNQFLDTYLAEFTAMTYTEECVSPSLGSIKVNTDTEADNIYCSVFPSLKQSIALLNKMIAENEETAWYGSVTDSVISKYTCASLSIYLDDDFVTITDEEKLSALKETLIVSEVFYKSEYLLLQYENYYDGELAIATEDGNSYISVCIPKEAADAVCQEN